MTRESKTTFMTGMDGSGTAGKHWSEAVFGDELMTPRATSTSLPLSKLTIAALRDLGYSVDYTQADFYTLPGHLVADVQQEEDQAG